MLSWGSRDFFNFFSLDIEVLLKNGIRIALGRFPEALETFLVFLSFHIGELLKNGIRIALGHFPEALETLLVFFHFILELFSKMTLELL